MTEKHSFAAVTQYFQLDHYDLRLNMVDYAFKDIALAKARLGSLDGEGRRSIASLE